MSNPTFDTLKTLFHTSESKIGQLNTQLKQVQRTNDIVANFREQIEVYTRYENMVEQRLTQLKTFLEDEKAITAEEKEIEELQKQMTDLSQQYTDIVEKNNNLATLVNNKYTTVENRIKTMNTTSTSIQETNKTLQNLINSSRATNYVRNKTVLLTGATGVSKELSLTPTVSMTFDRTKLPENPLSDGGGFKLGYDLILSTDGRTITYIGKADSVTLTLNFEVLSSSDKVFDTTSEFSVIVGTNSATDTTDTTATTHPKLTAVTNAIVTLSNAPGKNTMCVVSKSAVTITAAVISVTQPP